MAASKRVLLFVALIGAFAGTTLAQSCQADALDRHNELRANHLAWSLGWDDALAKRAQDSAKKLARNGCAMQGGSGGNVWQCRGKNCGSCSKAADDWYKPVSSYKFTSTPLDDNNFAQVGTFTQLVWNSATVLGCAMATGTNCAVVTCFYDKGNLATNEAFAQNVNPVAPSPSPMPSPSPVSASDSADQQPWCKEWAAKKFCEPAGPEFLFADPATGITKTVADWCPISCPKPAAVPTKPVDEQPQCAQWAAEGMCTTAGRLFMFQDPKTNVAKEIGDWCRASCPFDPTNLKVTNVKVAAAAGASRKLLGARPVVWL